MSGSRYLFRVVIFGVPHGPWREDRLQAQRDAIELDLGSYDEWGTFYLTVPADIEFAPAEQLIRVA